MIERVFAQVIDKDKIDKLPGTDLNINSLFTGFIDIALTIIAITAFGGLIYSGFMYITSSGDAGKVETARKNIVWSLTGIILASLSFLLVQFLAGLPTSDFSNTNNSGGNNSGGVTASTIEVTAPSGSANDTYTITDPTQPFSTQYSIKLSSKPSGNVTVNANLQGNLDLQLLDTALIFTPDNYNSAQTVRITYGGKSTVGSSTVTFSGAGTKVVSFEIQ